MDSNFTTLNISAFAYNPVEVNQIFTKCRVRLFYTGLNRNNTFITKEFAEQLLASLPYTPVGGLWEEEDKDFSDHGGPGASNRAKFQAFGVVPENPNITWENHLDPDGNLREYANCDVYLWTARYPQAKEIPTKSQSMELYINSIDGSWKRDGAIEYFEFTKGKFFGLVALGKKVEPCFEGSAFYTCQNEIFSMIDELKKCIISTENELIGGEEKMAEENIEKVVESDPAEETEVENSNTEATTEVTEETPEVEVEPEVAEVAEPVEEPATEHELEDIEEEDAVEVPDEAEDGTIEEVVEEPTNFALVIEELNSQIQTLTTELENVRKEADHFKEYFTVNERAKKSYLIERYAAVLDADTIDNFNNSIDSYSYEDLKKDIAVLVLEEKADNLFSVGETSDTVINVETTEHLSGAARLMGKYFKNN